MPNYPHTPHRRLTTWDKVSLYTLDELARYGNTSSRMPVIKHCASLIVQHGLADVSAHPGALRTVSSSLRKLENAGIVTRCCGGRGYVYKLNTANNVHVSWLIATLRIELIINGNFNGAFGATDALYEVLYQTAPLVYHGVTVQQTRRRRSNMQSAYTRRRNKALKELGL